MDVREASRIEAVNRRPSEPRIEARERAQLSEETLGTIECEIWRRMQDRREAALAEDLTAEQKLILPLALCVARLAARQDTRMELGK